VLKLTGRGVAVGFLLATSGDKGTKDPELDPAALGRLREAEQEAAARLLGIDDVEFLRHPDAELEESPTFYVVALKPPAPDSGSGAPRSR